jgi:hypothetical protein
MHLAEEGTGREHVVTDGVAALLSRAPAAHSFAEAMVTARGISAAAG